jgi:hypothetical protein
MALDDVTAGFNKAIRYTIIPEVSRLYIDVHTNAEPIWGRATWLSGMFSGAWANGRLELDPPPDVQLLVPIASLKSENAFYDREMRAAMASRRHPNILAKLYQLKPLDEWNHYEASGEITVRGSTQMVSGRFTITALEDTVTIAGEHLMDIRKFGVDPPRIPLLKISPEFFVRMALTFRRSAD